MDDFYKVKGKGDALRLALSLSEITLTEIKDDSYKRVPNPGRNASDLLEELLVDKKSHLVFILRNDAVHADSMKPPYWEVGGCTMGKQYDEFLFMYLSYDNGARVAERYGLEKM
jgi:hypothetical protein